MVTYSFEKEHRLLDAKSYKAVFDDAQLKVSRPQVLLLCRLNALPQSRIGLVIAKKNVKLAVQRNRIKRIARETFRLHQHKLTGIDAVVLARKGLDKLDNDAIHTMFNQLWRQLKKKADKQAQ